MVSCKLTFEANSLHDPLAYPGSPMPSIPLWPMKLPPSMMDTNVARHGFEPGTAPFGSLAREADRLVIELNGLNHNGAFDANELQSLLTDFKRALEGLSAELKTKNLALEAPFGIQSATTGFSETLKEVERVITSESGNSHEPYRHSPVTVSANLRE